MDSLPPSILPYGRVLSWTASGAQVSCPYRCGRAHHTVNFQWTEIVRSEITALCADNTSCRFRLLFPFQEHGVALGLGYVLDTEHMQWLTVLGGLKEGRSLSTDLHDVSIAYSKMEDGTIDSLGTSFSSSFSEQHVCRYDKWPFAECCLGGLLIAAQAMLMLSNEPRMILESDARPGETTLQHACSRGLTRPAMFLLDNGADPNHSSQHRDPPLVLSLLNQHFNLALLLLERGASPVTTTRHGQPILCILQRHHSEGLLEDTTTLNTLVEFYKAKVADDQLITTRAQPQSPPRVLIHRGANPESRPAAQLQVYMQTFNAPMKSQTTAYAALHRGPPFAPVHALSGITRGRHAGAASDGTLDREIWVPRVLALASAVGHVFPARESRAFWASHAEKQVVAFFVWTHTAYAVQAGLAGQGGEGAERVVVSAPGGAVGIGRDVVVSGRMCKDCEAFVGAVERAVGVRFRVGVAEALERTAPGAGPET